MMPISIHQTLPPALPFAPEPVSGNRMPERAPPPFAAGAPPPLGGGMLPVLWVGAAATVAEPVGVGVGVRVYTGGNVAVPVGVFVAVGQNAGTHVGVDVAVFAGVRVTVGVCGGVLVGSAPRPVQLIVASKVCATKPVPKVSRISEPNVS